MRGYSGIGGTVGEEERQSALRFLGVYEILMPIFGRLGYEPKFSASQLEITVGDPELDAWAVHALASRAGELHGIEVVAKKTGDQKYIIKIGS